jgi:hypothetical protein
MKRRKRKWVELANQPPLSSPKCERARDDKIDELGALYILEKLKEAKEEEKKRNKEKMERKEALPIHI